MKRLTSEINGRAVVKCDFDNELEWIEVRGGTYSHDHERFLTGPIADVLKRYEDMEELRKTATLKEMISSSIKGIVSKFKARLKQEKLG